MTLRLPKDFLFPLAVFAFIGLTVQYVGIVFTPSTRWAFVALLMLYQLVRGRFLSGLRSPFGAALAAYCGWCVLTSLWSEAPLLSLEKVTAFLLVALTFLSAGHRWARERGVLGALSYLAPVTAVALFAGLAGGASVPGGTQQELELYQGLTDNPNMMGGLVVMALPFLLWNAYRHRAKPQARWVWFGLVAIAAALLLRTHSRAAMLNAGMLAIGLFLSFKLSRTAFIGLLIMGAMLVATAAGTPLIDSMYNDYITKGTAPEEYVVEYNNKFGTELRGGILFSRQMVWQQSYDNAVAGGWFGAGYGVTVGDTSFQGGLTAVGYGREKGNTQLAIVEETGVVGLVLYSILLATLFRLLISAYLRESSGDMKVALGILTGCLAGFTLMSVFEAWWVAPGSPEAAYFWALAGVGLGLVPNSFQAARMPMPGRIVPGPALHLAFPPHRRARG